MKFFVYIYIALLGGNVFAQEGRCDSFNYSGHFVPFDTIGVQFTSDYIKNKGELQNHVTDRDTLRELSICLNANGKMIFDRGLIEINLGSKLVNPLDYFFDTLNTTIFNNRGMPYGILPTDSIVPCISSIIVSSFVTPDTAFSDLLRPNLYRVYGSVRPVKAYICDSGFIYIYLFGETFEYESSLNLSYMAKLIFAPSGKYIGRIVERGSRLNYFRFFDCCEFIGF